jgi:hypothetical protein
MGPRSRDRAASISVLVARDRPGRDAVATRVVHDAIRRAVAETPGDIPTGLSAALAAASPPPRTRGTRTAPTGIGAVVVAGDIAWTATRGAVDAYLLRDGRIARIAPPAPRIAPPAPRIAPPAHRPARAAPRFDTRSNRQGSGPDPIARTSLVDGDTLLLASRDLLRELGTEELKSAALTLHPAAAAEHLRRLFAIAGGRGSDSALAIDVALAQTGGRRGRGDAIDRRIRPTPPRTASAVPPARRAALGLASFASVVAIVALLVVVLPGGGERVAAQDTALGAAVSAATDRLTRAENVAAVDPAEALDLYLAAWAELDGTPDPDAAADAGFADLTTRIGAGIDAARGGGVPEIRTVTSFDSQAQAPEPGSLARGPGGDLFYIDSVGSVVTRVDPDEGDRADIVHRGDRSAEGNGRIGRPVQLESTGDALLIVDDDARLWRWRPSDDRDGTLTALGLGPDDERSPTIGDVATYPDPNGFRVYLVDPHEGNIIRYQPGFDGRSFTRSEYLVNDDEAVEGFRQLHIDERVFALSDGGVRSYEFGRAQHFRTDLPPDDADVRPGQAYRLIAGTDRTAANGHLYLYDEAWDRIVVFDKVEGRYVRQWLAAPGDAAMDDVLGLTVTTGLKKRPDTLHWLTAAGVFEAVVPSTVAQAASEDDGPTRSSRADRRQKGRSR